MNPARSPQGAVVSVGEASRAAVPATTRIRQRVQRRPVHGVLLLDKPIGMTSHQALQKARWLLRAEKAGHTGTLDPLATGVLPLCFGAATKFGQSHIDADKSYRAVAVLGVRTRTGDREGEVVERRSVNVSDEQLQRVAAAMAGPILQLPPMHSALKVDGRPLYDYARAGEIIERQPRPVHIHELKLALTRMDTGERAIEIEVRCSKGTYIRTLAEDIGAALGCGAHLASLRRTASGGYTLAQCVTLDQLEALSPEQALATLQPIEALLAGHVPVRLDAGESGRFLSGLRRRGPWPDAPQAVVYGPQRGALLGVASIRAGELIPQRLLSPVEVRQLLVQHEPPDRSELSCPSSPSPQTGTERKLFS